MASVNVIEWIESHITYVGESVLEVGSKKYNEHAYLGLRELLTLKKPETTLTGCDISSGEGVDVIVDMTAPLGVIKSTFNDKGFDTVFCISVLEHIPDVFNACRNISALLNPGGALFISVPFVFRYHGYPGDLWRFTPEAVHFLFPDIDFAEYKYSSVSTLDEGDTLPLCNRNMEKLNRFLFRPKSREEILERKRAKKEGESVPTYSLAPAMINMLGLKK